MAQTIGRYEIGRELGRGAQSVVYLAWDPQLQREVAIKTMHFDVADPHLNGMLLAEARTVSKLHHANVVSIYDAGVQDSDPYLVFEYVAGPTLADLLREHGPMEQERAAGMLRQVMDALTQAHELGIIHRDLKPSNILIDPNGTPRVMDFGIATRLSEAADASQQDLMGTPSYLAPEYVKDKVVTEQVDVYAAGLILLEMITGRKVVTGDTIGQILYKVLNEEVVLPPGMDPGLGEIVLKACARDPAVRYANAGQMRQALDKFLGSAGVAALPATETDTEVTLKFLLRRMKVKSDFPALSDSVSAINQLTDSDNESVESLSKTILHDYALTNKILRLVNSAYYLHAGGGNITTVSRAVIVLGFNTIRNTAINLLLFEHMKDKVNARELKESFLQANLSGLLARDISKKLAVCEPEEAFICALFHNLGRLLALFYFPEEADSVHGLMRDKGLTEAQASSQVLSLTYEELGIGIAHSWGFPSVIANAMRQLPEGAIAEPTSPEESLRIVSGFANELCDLVVNAVPENRGAQLKALDERFAACHGFASLPIYGLVKKSAEELAEVAAAVHVTVSESRFLRQLQLFVESEAGFAPAPAAERATVKAAEGSADLQAAERTLVGDLEKTIVADIPREGLKKPTGTAVSPRETALQSAIETISATLTKDFSVADVLGLVLKTMYRAGGFKRVLLCLKDAKNEEMAARIGFGPDVDQMVKLFRFSLAFSPDVFHLVIAKGVDILIKDIDDPKIVDKIPHWFRDRIRSRSFLLFPLLLKGVPVGMIYCDKEQADGIQLSDHELQLFKALRDQALQGMRHPHE